MAKGNGIVEEKSHARTNKKKFDDNYDSIDWGKGKPKKMIACGYHDVDEFYKEEDNVKIESKRYVVGKYHWPNCPVCDGEPSCRYANYFFFNDVEELKNDLMKDGWEHLYANIYQTDGLCLSGIGNSKCEIEQEEGFHHIKGIFLKWFDEKYRTIDNGSGKQIWESV